jgi:hypothetical protein
MFGHEQTVRQYYEARNRGDREAMLDLVAEDAVFHVAGRSPISGDHRGRAELQRLGAHVFGETGGTYRTDLLDVLANGTHVVSRHRWSATRNGRSIEMVNFNVFRFAPDGRICERWEFVEDDAAHDSFWS